MAAVTDVQAAGGVLWRDAGAGVEVLVVHRPKYDDWSFPKGKLDPGEDHATAAVREVAEETAYDAELGAPLPSTGYRDGRGRPKVVRYWAMTVRGGDGAFRPTPEVDEIRWLPVDEARSLLSYDHDRDVLDAFARDMVRMKRGQ